MLGKPNLEFEIVLTNGVIKTGPGQQLKLQHQSPLALVNHNDYFLIFFDQKVFEMNLNVRYHRVIKTEKIMVVSLDHLLKLR